MAEEPSVDGIVGTGREDIAKQAAEEGSEDAKQQDRQIYLGIALLLAWPTAFVVVGRWLWGWSVIEGLVASAICGIALAVLFP